MPKTAIPRANESAVGQNGADTWLYARTNPDEHFAEVYAKAVHVPEKLHDELVDRPATEAREASERAAAAQRAIDDLQAQATPDPVKLAQAQKRLVALKDQAAHKQSAKQQRGEEFRIMREDVFHTDKAVAMALQRLHTKKVDNKKLAEFERRAAIASTPEQIAYLESEAMK